MDIQNPMQLAKNRNSAYQTGDYLLVAQHFKAASEGYAAQGNPTVSVEMSNNQSVALIQAGDAQAALDAALGTDELFSSTGEERLQAMALGNIGAALDALNSYDEAKLAYTRSSEIFTGIGDDKQRAIVLQSLSQLRSGQQLEALATMQPGVEDIRRPNLRQRILKILLKAPLNMLNLGNKS